MDYIARAAITTCNNRKFKIFTSKQCLFGTLLMLFLATNGWGFETNVDSKVTANFAVTGALDVTGALKAGSVDSSSSAIAISIADTNNNTTIPTTSAVKTYVDAAVASGSSSSGGYPTEVKWLADDRQLVGAFSYCKNFSGGWRLPSVNELINLSTDSSRYFWTTDYDLDSGKYIKVIPGTGQLLLGGTSDWGAMICVK